MARKLVPRYLAALELSTLDDDEIHTLAGNIALAAKTSTLVSGNSLLQAAVMLLATQDGELVAANKTVDDDRTTLRVDIAAEAQVRSNVVGVIRMFGSMVAGVARSPADVNGCGLEALGPRPARNALPTVPGAIDNKPPRTGHGKTTVSVVETGATRHQYAAQESLDGITWTQLGVGLGKTRVVTGASGTNVWVRFAMVRGRQQSAWSTPVLVTIP
jgi:hypothetical protein